MKRSFSWLALLTATSFALLAVYSFSQVDLNLTLSAFGPYQLFQRQLTFLGYFNRPLSTGIYIGIVFLLAMSYWLLAKQAQSGSLTKKQVWLLLLLAVILLLPSYPAFSHDIFNYLFDARIVTTYGLSPWQFKALDFPADEWIRFMRWTHRPSVYPPIWILISLVPSLLGFGKFVLTLLWFKLLVAGAYLGSSKLLFDLAKKLKHHNPLFTVILYSFNPLVIVEGLVNAHMEMVMVFFGLLAVKLFLEKKKVLSWLSLVLSIGIKYMTAYVGWLSLKGEKALRQTIWLGFLGTLAFIVWYGFQPWYLLWVFPFALLLKEHTWEKQLLLLATVSALFWNVPLVLRGDFELPDPTRRLLYVVVPLLIGVVLLKVKPRTLLR